MNSCDTLPILRRGGSDDRNIGWQLSSNKFQTSTRRVYTRPLIMFMSIVNASSCRNCSYFPVNLKLCTIIFVILVPVDCQWNPWTEWTPCSLPCGIGQRSRDRSYIQSVNGSVRCDDTESHQDEYCNTDPCPSKLCRFTSKFVLKYGRKIEIGKYAI